MAHAISKHAESEHASPYAAMENLGRSPSMATLARDVGPVVYFIRTRDGLIKIGHTTDLASRKRYYGSGWQHILAVTPGTLDDETALHERFAEHVARGREYFHPAPEIVEHINEIRERMGVAAV